jgi:hypothetical protein
MLLLLVQRGVGASWLLEQLLLANGELNIEYMILLGFLKIIYTVKIKKKIIQVFRIL